MTDEQKNTPVGHMLDSAIILMQQQGSDQLTMGRVAEKSGYSLSVGDYAKLNRAFHQQRRCCAFDVLNTLWVRVSAWAFLPVRVDLVC